MTTSPPHRSPSPHHDNDPLDDVWGADSAPASPSLHPAPASPALHPSDIPRLRQEHATAGYRDGVAAAKAGSAQAGFDEGFGLGAVLGARAGRALGVLEGLGLAVPGDERLRGLVEAARRELGVGEVFAREFWDGEGVWRFEVLPRRGGGGDGGGDGEEIVFADVAGAHPLVRKWEGILEEEARRCGVDLEVLSGEEGVVRAGDEGAGERREDGKSAVQVKEKKALDW